MSLRERNAKIYGAVETETFISFEGFCKKIYATEQQEIEVFIDKEKIDTIKANDKIPSIEDKYEVFDTIGFCFKYTLPKKYLGEKHLLEFKTKDGKHLLHSPIVTIDSLNEKYNEYCFLESLKEVDREKIKDMYCPNCIGFLATKENLEDEEFVRYIKELIEKFPTLSFKALYFDVSSRNKLEQVVGVDNLEVVLLDSIETLLKACYIVVFNAATLETYNTLWNFITLNCKNIHTFAYEHNWINKKIDINTINRFDFLFKSTIYESKKLSETKTLYELWFYDSIEYAINSQSFVVNNFNFRNSF